ncbi:MAG: DNA primase [Bacilli bacterium]|nr:DNA primase [Bacilli bacterium]
MAYISNELTNEIQNRCDIVEVISKYVQLSKRGKNYFGLCPFHDDHNASMSVSPDKQIYKCFSCGESGNVFTFVAKYNNISFHEAVILLGKEKGYDLQDTTSNMVQDKHTKDYEIYDYACKIYQNNLYTSSGKSAIEYLTNRKIDKDTIKKFKIGLSLNKSIITEYLVNKNYDITRLIDLGLTNDRSQDKFLNRIMFPLFDLKGRVVAFSGRIYNTKSDSKYINTMETDIFKKGNLLYNYHNAKDSLKKTDYVIVMEGFMDVIRASTIGVNNCVATMGTAFTKEHIELLRKMTDNIILCFDGDKAGEDATVSSLKMLEDNGITPRIIRLPEDLDPDEYILKYGSDSFKYQIENTITPIEFKMQILKSNKNLTDLTDISKYIDEAISELVKVEDPILVELTLKKLSTNYNINYDTLKNKYNNYLQNKKEVVKYRELVKKKEKLSQVEIAEYHLIYYMLNDYKVIKEVEGKVIYFPDDLIRYLYNEIVSFYNKYNIINISSFISYISKNNELLSTLNKVIGYINKEEYTMEEISDYIKVVNNYLKKDRIKTLESDLRKEIDPIKKAEILNKIMEIKGVKS